MSVYCPNHSEPMLLHLSVHFMFHLEFVPLFSSRSIGAYCFSVMEEVLILLVMIKPNISDLDKPNIDLLL